MSAGGDGADSLTRTDDLPLTRRLLYQLSYAGVKPHGAGRRCGCPRFYPSRAYAPVAAVHARACARVAPIIARAASASKDGLVSTSSHVALPALAGA